MVTAHILGYPRIGKQRELKKAVEAYWAGSMDRQSLFEEGKRLRKEHWQAQKDAGLSMVTVNDFSWYDQVLDMASLFGVVPSRFGSIENEVDIDTYFRMGRGRAPTGKDTTACEMTKWFDTNYHYMVPELTSDQSFRLSLSKPFEEVEEAKSQGYTPKPVIIGPLTFLWLSKAKGEDFDKLSLLNKLLPVYKEVLEKFKAQGVEWVQIDEPILTLDLDKNWQQGFKDAYKALEDRNVKLLLTTYFGSLEDNLDTLASLSVDGWHIDAIRSQDKLQTLVARLPKDAIFSVGTVDGRNIWRTDLRAKLEQLKPLHDQLGDRLWVASSCSLLHSPVDLDVESKLDDEFKSWLAFSKQKVAEISTLATALTSPEKVESALKRSDEIRESRNSSSRIHNPAVKKRMSEIKQEMWHRPSPYQQRAKKQKAALNLPLFPTTTIGSFPQTGDIRKLRRDLKRGDLSYADYVTNIKKHIEEVVREQEALGLDVLVHGEAERNDMVEYFGELLDGYAFTQNGWVQSYGSRCVKPPIIYGDVSRPKAMTVEWTQYAQSLTPKLMKGMLTGPVTMLCWSFVRDDQPRSQTSDQIALALRDEMVDLEKAGIKVIQLDEPAFREGLPLRHKEWISYLEWAVRSFRLATSGVQDETQVHTHMCYSEFNDVIESIAAMDADVITIETSRSQMELLDAFETFNYPNEIGPGVYDIHSPRVPDAKEMVQLMQKASERIPAERLWINPDCGLKTRGWAETKEALSNMVKAAQTVRASIKNGEPELA